MRAIFLSLLLLFATAPADAQHNIFLSVGRGAISPTPPVTCPFGTTGLADNGCSTSQPAVAGSSQYLIANGRATPTTSGLNAITATPTDYSTTLPSINIPGIDYPEGSYTPVASLLPTTSGTIPSGCAIGATPGITGNTQLVTCTPTAILDIDMSHYDLTNGGSGHLTTCISILVSGNLGRMNITDNYAKNNGYCSTGSAGNEIIATAASRTTAYTHIAFNTLDANSMNFPWAFGACPQGVPGTPEVSCNPTSPTFTTGDAHEDHNAFIGGWVGRPIQYASYDSAGSTMFSFDYNVLPGCCSESSLAHNEFVLVENGSAGNPVGGHEETGNLLLTGTAHQNAGEAPIPTGLPNGAAPQIGPTAIQSSINNVIIDSWAGGGSPANNVVATVGGNANGNTFTTNFISGNFLGSGTLVTCGTNYGGGNFDLSFDPIYNAAYTTGGNSAVSAGPAGGGNSGWANPPTNTILNQASKWDMNFNTAVITASIDNGSGTGTPSGNVLTVSIDNSLTLTIGTKVLIGGTTLTISSFGSGTGATGTYNMSGSAASASQLRTVTPVSIYPGGWTVPSTLNCPNRALGVGVSFGTAQAGQLEGELGSWTLQGNYFDLWAYGSSALAHPNFIQTATATQFGGVITGGNALQVEQNLNSTTVTSGGSSYTSAPTVNYTTDCLIAPVGTAVLSGNAVASITQTTKGVGCTTATVSSFTGGGGTGAAATPVLSNATISIGFGLLTQSGIPVGVRIQSLTSTNNYALHAAGTSPSNIGPVLMSIIASFCDTPANWSVGNPNVDMSGVNGSTVMNSFGTSTNSLNGCGP